MAEPHIPPEVPFEPPPQEPIVPTTPSGREPRDTPPSPGLPEELADRLLQRRIVVLTGHLDHGTATRAAAQLMILDADGDAPIEMHFGCPDADLDAATTLAEVIDLVGVPVRAVALGAVGGPAIAAYLAAPQRLAHPHCVFHLHEPRVRLEGSASDVAVQARRHEEQVRLLRSRIAEVTGRPYGDVAEDLRTTRMLGAEAAVEYGIVQEIVAPPRGPARRAVRARVGPAGRGSAAGYRSPPGSRPVGGVGP